MNVKKLLIAIYLFYPCLIFSQDIGDSYDSVTLALEEVGYKYNSGKSNGLLYVDHSYSLSDSQIGNYEIIKMYVFDSNEYGEYKMIAYTVSYPKNTFSLIIRKMNNEYKSLGNLQWYNPNKNQILTLEETKKHYSLIVKEY